MPHRELPRSKLFRARSLRSNMTDAERRMWQRLRAHRLGGVSFRRQFAIGAYVVDFACLESRIVVEIDGGQHADSQRDVQRDAWLRSQGFEVLRFWNNDVLSNTSGVLEVIAGAVSKAPPSLTLPRKGGGNRPEQGVKS